MPDEMTTDSCRDWPANLRLSSAVDTLARVIYESRAVAFLLPRQWTSEPSSRRAEYRSLALKVLEDLKPARILRQPEPSAAERGHHQPDYYRIAVDNARAQFGVPSAPQGVSPKRASLKNRVPTRTSL